MADLHLLYACVGATAVVLALVSGKIRQLPLSEPLVGLVLGVVLGPAVLGLVVLEESARDLLLLEGARLLLAWSVMAAALRYPVTGLRGVAAPVALLLAVVMPLAAVLSGAAALLLGLPVALAAVVGACLCPTDPVLAASVVTGEPAERDLPARLRRLLTAESGANDGLALPLVGVALAVVLPATAPGDVVGRIAWEVLGGTAIGVVVGVAVGLGLRWATRHHDLSPGPELVLTLLLAVATLGIARVAHTGGVLAVFVAGLAYNRAVGEGERGAQDRVDEAVNRYAVVPLFVVLGAVLPWADWAAFGLPAVAFVAAVLLLRRLPVVLALGRPLRLDRRDATFVGWFGPVGVSAVFYVAHSLHEGVRDPRLFAAGTLAVAASVVAFGLSGTPGRRAYVSAGDRVR
ncbi:cation:proton antiporter [Cellulomonas sp. ATA003]|uniref:cation:proton antiporter domain-containing protein n=1 Tax=Cellulomonas sp. ATA003 TaxID=3073064 RepID=UPI002872D37E|nr:cation:proton antiporter [Cellulomonas sp. ATA003]WNB86935.1 cation:proton antiporter [Cellulomonas sp. ATA003]